MIALLLATLFQCGCLAVFWWLLRDKAQAEVEAQATAWQRRMSAAIGLILLLNILTVIAHVQQLLASL